MKKDLVTRLIDLTIAIQQIPAPTFHEQARAEFVRRRFIEEGIPAGEVRLDKAGNVLARVAGEGQGRCAVVSAHLDTVFQLDTDLRVERREGRLSGAGIGDNALGVAGLFGLLWNLREGEVRLGSATHPGDSYRQGCQRQPDAAAAGVADTAVPLRGCFANGGLSPTLRSGDAARTPPRLANDLWLVANVREEGLGNLDGMRAVVEFFEGKGGEASEPPWHDKPCAYIALEGIGLGHVYHRGLGVRRRRVTVRTAGGHSWNDAGEPSAVHELMRLGARLVGLAERKEAPHTALIAHENGEKVVRNKIASPLSGASWRLTGRWRPVAASALQSLAMTGLARTGDALPRSTLNIGVISGGLSVNTIAAEAMLELDLRSESAEALEALTGEVEREVEAARIRLGKGARIELEVIGDRPWGELSREHPLVRLCEECLRGVGIRPHLSTGSTDANLPLSRGLPAVALGLTSGGGAHSSREFIDVGPLGKGIEALTRVVRGVWQGSAGCI